MLSGLLGNRPNMVSTEEWKESCDIKLPESRGGMDGVTSNAAAVLVRS